MGSLLAVRPWNILLKRAVCGQPPRKRVSQEYIRFLRDCKHHCECRVKAGGESGSLDSRPNRTGADRGSGLEMRNGREMEAVLSDSSSAGPHLTRARCPPASRTDPQTAGTWLSSLVDPIAPLAGQGLCVLHSGPDDERHALPCRRNNIGRIRRKPPNPMRFVEVFHLFCSVTKISRFASAPGRRSVAPEGQRISIQSACGAAPKP